MALPGVVGDRLPWGGEGQGGGGDETTLTLQSPSVTANGAPFVIPIPKQRPDRSVQRWPAMDAMVVQ